MRVVAAPRIDSTISCCKAAPLGDGDKAKDKTSGEAVAVKKIKKAALKGKEESMAAHMGIQAGAITGLLAHRQRQLQQGFHLIPGQGLQERCTKMRRRQHVLLAQS